MRDLKADLELCNRVNKGRPWRLATNRHLTTQGFPWGWIEGTLENWCWSRDKERSYQEAKFIVGAHQGWPHAIERAIKAEELARELVAALQGVSGMLDYATGECRCGVCEYCNAQERADKALAKAKEVLGDE